MLMHHNVEQCYFNEISDCRDRYMYRDQLQIVTVSGYIVCCRFVSAFQDTSIARVPHNHTPMFDLVSCSLLYNNYVPL